MSRLFTAAVLLVSIACLSWISGCANKEACCETDKAGEKAASVAVINTICPVEGDDFTTSSRPSELARTWNGQSIGFCCDHCIARFDKMSDEKKNAVAAAAAANKQL